MATAEPLPLLRVKAWNPVMPLSEKTKYFLMKAVAISPIMNRFMLPGIIGMLLTGVGVWQEMTWLAIAGLVLAAPILWCYVVG